MTISTGITTGQAKPSLAQKLKKQRQEKANPSKNNKPGGGGSGSGSGKPVKAGSGSKLPWFVRPLTGKDYKKELAAQEREQFGPLRRQLDKEILASRQAEDEQGHYFNDYQQRMANLRAQTAQGYQTAAGQTSALLQQTGAQDAERMSGIQAAAAADAAKRGVDQDLGVSQRAASANSARQNLGATFGALTATQGANANAYLADKERIGAGESLAQRAREAARRRAIAGDQRELAQKMREFRSEFRRGNRESEREFYLARGEQKGKSQYNKAIVTQAQLGANKHVTVDNNYNGAGGGKSGVTDVRTVSGYLKSNIAKNGRPPNPASAVSYLVNRGVNRKTAQQVVSKWFKNHPLPDSATHFPGFGG